MSDERSEKDRKLIDPQDFYTRPLDVVLDAALTQDEKRTALKNWEDMLMQLQTASGENMPDVTVARDAEPSAVLQRLQKAKAMLDQGP